MNRIELAAARLHVTIDQFVSLACKDEPGERIRWVENAVHSAAMPGIVENKINEVLGREKIEKQK